jgi:hypothetical protein
MGYPPPPAGPRPPYPFAAGEDIAAAEAHKASTTANAKQLATSSRQQQQTAAFVASRDAAAQATAAYAKPFDPVASLSKAASDAIKTAVASPTPTNVAAAQAAMAALAQGETDAVASVLQTTPPAPVQDALDQALAAEAEGIEDAMQVAAALAAAMYAVSKAKQELANLPVLATQFANDQAAALLAQGELAIAEAAGATVAEAEKAIAGLSLLCEVFEAGLSAELGGDIAISLSLALQAGASAGVTATCCGFTLNLSLAFLINFQLPPIPDILILLPYLGFSISCDPTKPVNLAAGLPWGGGRQPNAPPDPDLDENSC